MNKDPIAALEIGTSRTVLAIGVPIAPGRIRVAGLGIIPSSGVRKSRIIDISRAGVSVESAVKRAETGDEVTVCNVNLALSGQQITIRNCRTTMDIPGPAVSENDMTELAQMAVEDDKSETACTLLDRSDVSWDLDELSGIVSPKGMNGKSLALHTLVIESEPRRLADAKAACTQAGVEVADAFFAGTCAAQGVLTTADRAAGTLVIDLGGGSTNWAVACDGRIVHAGVLGVGGEHLVNDIREAFAVSRGQAAELVLEASAAILPERETGRVALSKSLTAFKAESVSRRALDTVVNARMAETLALVRDNLDAAGVLHRLNGGVTLTGGGAYLTNLPRLTENIFGCTARIGSIVPEIEGLEKEPEPARLAVVAGLLLIAQKNAPDEDGLFDSLFGTFGKVFRK